MRKRKLVPAALAWAKSRSPMPASLVEQAISTYLDGLARIHYDKNPRVRSLAYMEVGDSIPWEGQLQTQDRDRARILLGKDSAQWKWRATTRGANVLRTA